MNLLAVYILSNRNMTNDEWYKHVVKLTILCHFLKSAIEKTSSTESNSSDVFSAHAAPDLLDNISFEYLNTWICFLLFISALEELSVEFRFVQLYLTLLQINTESFLRGLKFFFAELIQLQTISCREKKMN